MASFDFRGYLIDFKCGICLKDSKSFKEAIVKAVPCGHLFERSCQNEWARLEYSNCPLCHRQIEHLVIDGENCPLSNPAGAVSQAGSILDRVLDRDRRRLDRKSTR